MNSHLKFFYLFQHKYVSIAEIQIIKEEEFQKTPLSGVRQKPLALIIEYV